MDEPYDMVTIMKTDRETTDNKFLFDLPDFTGPAQIEKLCGRGRGLVATEDIHPGQLITAAKAIAVIQFPNNDVTGGEKMDLLKEAVKNALIKDPKLSSKVYNLHAGPKLGYLELDQKSENGEIDEVRIEKICALNGFQCDSKSGVNEAYYGLWYFPAFINHSCYRSNTYWRGIKNMMFIRATKVILKGQEITTTYFDPNIPWEERRCLFKKYEFTCDCLLCDLERNEGVEVRKKRDEILSHFKTYSEPVHDFELAQSWIQELEDLRPYNPELNVFLIQPLIQLGLYYYEEKCDYENAVKVYENVFELCRLSAPFHLASLCCALTIATSYLRLDREASVIQEWVDAVKDCTIVQFGTFKVLECIRPKFFKEIKLAGFHME